MDASQLDALDKLSDVMDPAINAQTGHSLDDFANPLDKIVGKFASLSTSNNAEQATFTKTAIEQKQLSDVMTTVGNRLMTDGGLEASALANTIGSSYFEIQHARHEMDGLAGRTDKATRAQASKVQRRFFEHTQRLREGYTTWKKTAYAEWKEKNKEKRKTRTKAVAALEDVRKKLREQLDESPEDKELEKLVQSLTTVKQSLASGDASTIALPDAPAFDPKKETFKEYLGNWKTDAIERHAEPSEDESDEETEENATPNVSTASLDAEWENVHIELDAPELPTTKATNVAEIEAASAKQTTTIRASAPGTRVNAAAGAATATTSAAATVAANSAMSALATSAAQTMSAIRANTVRSAGGGNQIRPGSRGAVRSQYAQTTQQIQTAAAANPGNAQIQDLSTLMAFYAPGVMQDDGLLPDPLAGQQMLDLWADDAGVEIELSDAAAPVESPEASDAAPRAMRASSTLPTRPNASAATAAALPSGRGGGRGAGGGTSLGPAPRGIGANPLGRAAGFLAAQHRDAFQQSAQNEIPTLSGDTMLSDNSLSAFGAPEAIGFPQPAFPTYAATGTPASSPFFGSGTGETLTVSEEAMRMRLMQQQQLATIQQFLGSADMSGAQAPGLGYVAAAVGAQRVSASGRAAEEERTAEEDAEEREAFEMNAQQQQSRMMKQIKDRVQKQLEKRGRELAQKMGKNAVKATNTSVRGVLEGTEIAGSEVLVPILIFIVQMNLQLGYKYFAKYLKSTSVGESEYGGKALKLGEVFEQSFIEDVGTVCMDVGICTNFILSPPMCCCTLPIIFFGVVILATTSFLGLDGAIDVMVKLLE